MRFLSIAHGSLAELKTQLILCTRVRWLDPESVAEPLALADRIARMLTTLKTRWRHRTHPAPDADTAPPRPHPIK